MAMAKAAAFWLVYSNWNLYIYANSHKYTMSCWPSWLSFWQFVVFLAIKDAVKLPTLLAMNELQIAASVYQTIKAKLVIRSKLKSD